MLKELDGKGVRMRQVFELLVEGQQEKSIAAQLRLSPHSVHAHTKHIYRLVKVNSRPQLMAKVVKRLTIRIHKRDESKSDPETIVL